MTRRLGFAVVLALALAPALRADEPSAKRALDDAEDQLAHKQWDLCHDALADALEQSKGLPAAARSAAQKRYGSIRERCDAGEKGYPHRKLVLEVKTTLANARKDVEGKDAVEAAALVDSVRKDVDTLDPPTHERFMKEIAAIQKGLDELALGAKLDYVEGLLERQDASIAACGSRTNASLAGVFAVVEGELAPLPADHPRVQATRARLAGQRAIYDEIARNERGLLVLDAAARWMKDFGGAIGAATPPALTLSTWRADSVLAHHCPRATRILEAAQAFRESSLAHELQERFPDDEAWRATLAEVKARDDAARAEAAKKAGEILDLCQAVPVAQRDEAHVNALRGLVDDLERLAQTGAGLEETLARAKTVTREAAETAPRPVESEKPPPVATNNPLPTVKFEPRARRVKWGLVGLVAAAFSVCVTITVLLSKKQGKVGAMTVRSTSSGRVAAANPVDYEVYGAPKEQAPPLEPPKPPVASPEPPVASPETPRAGPAPGPAPVTPVAPGTLKRTSRANAFFEQQTTPDSAGADLPPGATPPAPMLPPPMLPSLGSRRPSAQWERPAPPPVTIGRDFVHEGHLRAIAFWQVVGGGLLLLLAMVVFGLAAGQPGGRLAALSLGGIGGVLLLLGYGIWNFNPIARWFLVAYYALTFFWTVAVATSLPGTVAPGFIVPWLYDAAIVWALLGGSASAIFSADYRRVVQASPGSIPFTGSPFFYAPFVMVGLNCCMWFLWGFGDALRQEMGQ